MKEIYKFKPIGNVTFTFLKDGKVVKQFQKKNQILPVAKSIVARRLADKEDSKIDFIRVYLVGGLIASGAIQSKDILSDTEVEFTAYFSVASFSGDFDEARLNASSMGDFSQLTAFIANKPADQELNITWKIKII